MTRPLVCAGPRPPGAAVGGGQSPERRPGQSSAAAAAEHGPPAAHLPAGQTDPGTGDQSQRKLHLQ